MVSMARAGIDLPARTIRHDLLRDALLLALRVSFLAGALGGRYMTNRVMHKGGRCPLPPSLFLQQLLYPSHVLCAEGRGRGGLTVVYHVLIRAVLVALVQNRLQV